MYKLLFIVATIFGSALGAQPRDQYDALKLQCEKELWAKEISLEDLSFDTFRANLEKIKAINKQGGTWRAGVNCLTLCNEEQFQRFLGAHLPPQTPVGGYPDASIAVQLLGEEKVPESYNHLERLTITQPRNQGYCGSCWAFAALSSLESGYITLTGEWHQTIDFSEQQMVDCTYPESRNSCNGGWMSEAWNAVYKQGNKLVSEQDHSYKGSDGKCNMTGKKNMMVKARLYAVQGNAYTKYSDKTVTKVMGEKSAQIIWKEFSVSVAIQAESAFMNYDSGIFSEQSKVNSINHAVTLYGYTSTYFWLQNSWGKSWGIQGNGKISRTDGNILQMFSYMMYPNMKCAYGENEVGYCKGIDGDLGCQCQNKGLCKPDSTCLCREGFTGAKCEVSDGCPCLNGGECMESSPVQCKCKEGFSGDRCEKKDTIDCECQNDGVCDLDSGKCKCKAGFTGDKCEKKDGSGCGCQNGGFCLDSGECKCKVGFSGDKCENRDDSDCGCQNGGKCMDNGKCACPKLYSGDKCEKKFNCDCKNGGKCVNGRCKCSAGYHGKECENKCDCENGGFCLFSGACKCKAGFTGDKCQEECGCKNGGTCVKDGCSCKKGWKGDQCEKFDGVCRCRNGGECDDEGKCQCKDGYTGVWCQAKECEPACENEGVCSNWGRCICKFPYIGPTCEGCGCMNNGTCADDNKCECEEGYRGLKCERKECENTCVNGWCAIDGKCRCQKGWSGTSCEYEEENKCTQKCRNNRQCYFRNKSRKMGCRCKPGTWGKKCEKGPRCNLKVKNICKKAMKNKNAFAKKCKFTWGATQCAKSCGYCKKN